MNDFDKIFENAVLLELIKVDNDGEKEASRSLYNYLFNEWLRKNFINELTEENYSVLCTEEKFNEFLKALNEEENKNKKENKYNLPLNKQLDEILKLIAKNLDDKGEIKKEWIFKNINKEKEIISDFNIGKALNKLVEDKYLKPSDIKEYYSTTWESLVFIENGGYAKQMEIQNTKLLTQKIINFSLIFGGLMTGAYYMAKACLWIFYHI